MAGRGRTRQVEDFIHFQPHWMRDIVADEFKVPLVQQVLDVCLLAGKKVVEADDIVAACHEAIAEVRAEEAGSAGHKDALAAFIYERQNWSPAGALNGSTTNLPAII